MLVVEVEFKLDGMTNFHTVDTRHQKSQAVLGNIVDLDNPATGTGGVNDPVGSGQAGCFTIKSPEVELDSKGGAAFTADS